MLADPITPEFLAAEGWRLDDFLSSAGFHRKSLGPWEFMVFRRDSGEWRVTGWQDHGNQSLSLILRTRGDLLNVLMLLALPEAS